MKKKIGLYDFFLEKKKSCRVAIMFMYAKIRSFHQRKPEIFKSVKYGHFENVMLPWKQLIFTKFNSCQYPKYLKHTLAKFHLYMFHKQEIMK